MISRKQLNLICGSNGKESACKIGAAAAAKSLQSCPTLCDPIDCNPPGYPVPGILQARTLEWVAIPFSNAWKGKVKVKSLSHVRLFATLWTVAYQASSVHGIFQARVLEWVAISFISNAGDLGSIPGSRRSPGNGNGNLLQYSCLENPMDRGASLAIVHGITMSWTRLSN